MSARVARSSYTSGSVSGDAYPGGIGVPGGTTATSSGTVGGTTGGASTSAGGAGCSAAITCSRMNTHTMNATTINPTSIGPSRLKWYSHSTYPPAASKSAV